MATKQARPDTGFIRCAVCKIDLKGRFVYLDEKIEDLLGYTQEDLFGKSLLEFLDKPSQQLIDQLLAQRNHYETFYDTTCLTLVNRDEEMVPARAVVSLNFIAGNPVNFQLILDQTVNAVGAGETGTTESPRLNAFLDTVLSSDAPTDLNQLLGHLRDFVRAEAACLYMIDGGYLEPRAAASNAGHGEAALAGLPQPSELHLHVAHTGAEYSFIDQEVVRKVIEQHGAAPTEYICRLVVGKSNGYVLRLLYAEDIDPLAARAAIDSARLGTRLLQKTAFAGAAGKTETDNAYDIKFTVGFLDSLGIGAFLTDRQGDVIGYNPATLAHFTESQLEGHYTGAIRPLVNYNSPGLEKRVMDYVTSLGVDEQGPVDLNLRLKTSPEDTVRLTVMKLGDAEGDQSSCFVLVPESGGRAFASDDHTDLQGVVKHLIRYLKSSGELSDKLAHRFHNELDDEGNEILSSLSSGAMEMLMALEFVAQVLQQVKRRPATQLVDLDLLVKQRLDRFSSAEGQVNCSYGNLPKVKSDPQLLATAIDSILSNAVKYNESDRIDMKIEAGVSGDTCHLEITDNGYGIAAKYLPKVTDFFYRVPDKRIESIAGQGLGLALAKTILQHLGGELSIDSTEGKGTTVSLNFPAG